MTHPPKDPDRDRICNALFSGRKIEAIKLYREMSGVGLKDAKEFVEALEKVLRREQPDRFAKSDAQGGGCKTAIIFLLGVLVLAVVWWLVL